MPPRTPPRFVPTLTEVVQPSFTGPAGPMAEPPEPAPPQPQPAWIQQAEPLPAEPGGADAPAADPVFANQPAAPWAGHPPSPLAVEQLQDQIIHRVMQRVDVALEHSLHEAVAAMVLQHTHALVPRLREEIEFVVRQAVADAVARELAERQP